MASSGKFTIISNLHKIVMAVTGILN